jgi:hypothetical protein
MSSNARNVSWQVPFTAASGARQDEAQSMRVTAGAAQEAEGAKGGVARRNRARSRVWSSSGAIACESVCFSRTGREVHQKSCGAECGRERFTGVQVLVAARLRREGRRRRRGCG